MTLAMSGATPEDAGLASGPGEHDRPGRRRARAGRARDRSPRRARDDLLAGGKGVGVGVDERLPRRVLDRRRRWCWRRMAVAVVVLEPVPKEAMQAESDEERALTEAA